MMAIVIHWPKQLTYPAERWPSNWSPAERFKDEHELEKLLAAISDSLNLSEACRRIGIDKRYIYRRSETDKEFSARVRAARDASLDLLAEKAIKVIDECANDLVSISKARAQQDGLLRLYGIGKRSQNLAQVNIFNDNRSVTVSDPERAELIERRNRALENNQQQKE